MKFWYKSLGLKNIWLLARYELRQEQPHKISMPGADSKHREEGLTSNTGISKIVISNLEDGYLKCNL